MLSPTEACFFALDDDPPDARLSNRDVDSSAYGPTHRCLSHYISQNVEHACPNKVSPTVASPQMISHPEKNQGVFMCSLTRRTACFLQFAVAATPGGPSQQPAARKAVRPRRPHPVVTGMMSYQSNFSQEPPVSIQSSTPSCCSKSRPVPIESEFSMSMNLNRDRANGAPQS